MWSRHHRALEVVRNLPLFRARCNTTADPKLTKANNALSRPRRLDATQSVARLKRPRFPAVEMRPVDDDASSILAEATNGLVIDDDDYGNDEDDMTLGLPVLGRPTSGTFEKVPSTESGVPVKSELSMGSSATTGHLRQFHQKHALIWEDHESAM